MVLRIPTRLTWLDLGGMSVMVLAQSGIRSISSFLQTCLKKMWALSFLG